MTREQIAELRKLDREAKQPPWTDEGGYVYPGDPDEVQGEAVWIFGTDNCGHPPTAALIVASRNALPKLLDEREALLEAVSNVADSILLYEKTPDEVVTGAMLADLGRILRAVRTKAESP